MTSLLTSAGKKLFEKHLEQYAPADPLYETYTDNRGREKRRKRLLPPGLSQRDQKILTSIKRRAHYLDKGFSLCGMRFGWTFIIGIIPGAGDVADISLNYFLVVRKARQADLPPWLVRRMLMNNAVSAAVGLVPFAGDVVLAMYKANSRNAALLEEFLRIRGEEYLKLTAAGKIPERVEGKKGKKSVKEKKKAVEPVPQQDVEQVKPGSGAAQGEVIEGTVPSSSSAAAGSSALAAPAGTTPSRKSTLSRLGSWMGGSNEKKAAAPASDKGRFVEDVGSN
ncbi:hypothetical protein C8J56DRAFT_715121, partial [Mycena floridula]